MRGSASNSQGDHGSTANNEIPLQAPAFQAAIVLTVILTGFVALQYFLPLRTALRIGADEGFETAKATLVLKGYQLYTEIWNDQPPLDTSGASRSVL